MFWFALVAESVSVPMPERVSSWAIYEIFNTSDGLQMFVGITSDGQWRRFCEFFKQPELAADPNLATNNQRIEARPWLVPKVAEIFRGYTTDALEQMCLEADISFAPVARPQDLFDHPHLLESLIKSDIVSSVGGVVNFQSRATKWYAESRLKHAGGGETHRRRW